MQDEVLPEFDRAPSSDLVRLCSDGGLLQPLMHLNGACSAEKHVGVPLDVHFRPQNEVHVYCGHARIIRTELVQRRRLRITSEHADSDEPLFRDWSIDTDSNLLMDALQAYLRRVDVGSQAEGEGVLQARWANLGHGEIAGRPWTPIDRESQFSFPNTEARGMADARAATDVGQARRVILDIARLRPPMWREPGKTGSQLDQIAVDEEGNLVLVEIKDAASADVARLFYAPLQLLKYVYIWHGALRRLAVWQQLRCLVTARSALGLSPHLPELTGGIRAAVCFGGFGEKPSEEVKRRFYEVLGVVNAHLPPGVSPIETWKFEDGHKPSPL